MTIQYNMMKVVFFEHSYHNQDFNITDETGLVRDPENGTPVTNPFKDGVYLLERRTKKANFGKNQMVCHYTVDGDCILDYVTVKDVITLPATEWPSILARWKTVQADAVRTNERYDKLVNLQQEATQKVMAQLQASDSTMRDAINKDRQEALAKVGDADLESLLATYKNA